MRCLIQALFVVSDFAAWAVVAVSLIGAAAYPVVEPMYAEMNHASMSVVKIGVTVALALLSAGGAFLLLKRRPFGFLLVILPALAWMIGGAVIAGLWYGALVVLIFGVPLALTYVESRRVNHERT